MRQRALQLGDRVLGFPAFLPVTTFGGRFPLDELVRPYLTRLAPALMVSYHYAQKMSTRPRGILFVDSGGFASLFDGSVIAETEHFASIVTTEGDRISPDAVLSLQEGHADVGATVDFIVPPGVDLSEAQRRQELTIRNAMWALRRKRTSKLRLFASVQAWDTASAVQIIQRLAPYPFDGYALGGMVPRIKRPDEIVAIVRAIRSIDDVRPLHVFGIGTPALMRTLADAGADSFDSSSFVRAAVDGKRLSATTGTWSEMDGEAALGSDEGGIITRRFGSDYLCLEGEANRMALALANLQTLVAFSGHADQARTAATSSSSSS